MGTLYNPDLQPLSDSPKFDHALAGHNHGLLSPNPPVNLNQVDDQPRKALKNVPNSSFTSIPSQAGPLISIDNKIPAENNIEMIRPTHPSPEVATKAAINVNVSSNKRKIRKRRKFRLIPTFKHLENGRFVGREEEIRKLRNTLLSNSALNKGSACFNQRKELESYSRLSLAAITGHNGIGKTSLAYVYLMAFESKYKYVFWVNTASILSDVRDILLYHLTNPYEVQSMKAETSAEVIKIRFLHFLSELQSDWLLVVDEFNDTEVKVQEWIPQRLERLSVDSLHRVKSGHVIITSSMTMTNIRRAFCTFQSPFHSLELGRLSKDESVKLIKHSSRFNDAIASNEEKDAVLRLVSDKFCNREALPIALMANLAMTSGYTWRTLLLKYKDEMMVQKLRRANRLKNIFRRVKEKELLKVTKRGFFSRDYLFRQNSPKKGRKRQRDIFDGFDSDIFEIELLLKKFKLSKYFSSIVDGGVTKSADLGEVDASFWRDLTFTDVKRKKLPFDPRDEEKFVNVRAYTRSNLAQSKVTACMKLWIEYLSVPSSPGSQTFHTKALEVLRESSWLSSHRIPLFLFPELLLDAQNEENDPTNLGTGGVGNGHSQASHSTFSTVTHNSTALSALHINPEGRYPSAVNGSSRFNGAEIELFRHRGLLSFFVNNSLLKMEKTGFISCPKLVQNAIMSLETRSETSFETILSLLKKLHGLGFEVNYNSIAGESLSLLRLHPELVKNAYTVLDLKYAVNLLQDLELQTYFNHDFNLKLNLLAHFNHVRKHCFRELAANKEQMHKFENSRIAKGDEFGVKQRKAKDFSKYLQFVQTFNTFDDQAEPKEVQETLEALREGFSATRASLFPDFSERDLTLVKADLIFNEGLLIINIPFRSSKFFDAFSCFKTAYNVYAKHLQWRRNSKDMTMAKCCFEMGVCLFNIGNLKDSLKVFELSLRHFHDFHGEYTNNPDIARNLSSIACVYHEMAKSTSSSYGNIEMGEDEALEANISDLVTLERNLNGGLDSAEKWAKADDDYSYFEGDFVDVLESNDKKKLGNEALKYHQLALQMYRDLFGNHPIKNNFAKALFNRAKTLVLLDAFKEAEEDMQEALSIYEILATKSVEYNSNVGNVAINLGNLCFQVDNTQSTSGATEQNFERFMFYLNKSMKAYSELSKFEMKILNINKSKSAAKIREDMLTKNENFILTDEELINLAPHPLLSETLVMASDVLASSGFPDSAEKSAVLLEAAIGKYQEIFGNFDHPRISSIQQKLESV